MPKLKLTTALNLANNVLIAISDRDIDPDLGPDNPYEITHLNFDHHSDLTVKMESIFDDDCCYQIYVNLVNWLIDYSDDQQYVDANVIEKLDQNLNRIADSDHRELTVNPQIVKLYQKLLDHQWASYLKQHPQLDQTQIKQSKSSDQLLAGLSAENQLLVAAFIDSLKK